MMQLYRFLAVPGSLPSCFVPPDRREQTRSVPDVLVVEHGGDLISANIPVFLRHPGLMTPVSTLILCGESALSVLGALQELESLQVRNSEKLRLFAAVPRVNPEAFYQRMQREIQAGTLAGLVDLEKPNIEDRTKMACDYSKHYKQILSLGELMAVIVAPL